MRNSVNVKKKRRKIRLFSRGNEKGIVTVLVTLLLVPVILFTGLMVDFARIKAFESQAVFAADLYGNSVLASYNNELYNMYALFGFTPNKELEEELKKIAESSFTGYEVTEQGVKRLVGMLEESFNPEQAAQVMAVFGNGEVSFDYAVAVSEGNEGNLGNNEILKTQITDYTVTRLPTYLVEESITGKSSEIESIMSAVETVKNLDKYSKITSIKGKLDAEMEVFFNFLTAYADDLYSLSSDSFSDYSKWEEYSENYGEYGTEELIDIIGEYKYDGQLIITEGLNPDNNTSYLDSVAVVYKGISDSKEEIQEYIDAIEEGYYEDEYGNYYFFSDESAAEAVAAIKQKINEKKDALERMLEDNGDFGKAKNNLDKVSESITKLINRVTKCNAYTDAFSSMKLKKLGGAKDMQSLGEKLDSKKEKINNLIKELYDARQQAIDGGCDQELIDEMIGDYSSIQLLTSDGFSYGDIGTDYNNMMYDLENSVLGNNGIMNDDLTMLEDDINDLISLCDDVITYAEDQAEAMSPDEDGETSAPLDCPDEISSVIRQISEITDYNAYKLDKYDLFGHEDDSDFNDYDRQLLSGINFSYFMSRDDTIVTLVYHVKNNESANEQSTVRDICEYIRESFKGKNVGEKKQNGILKKSKKLLDELDGVDLNVYESNDTVIGDAVYGALSSTEAAEEKDGSSLANMLNNIDTFFPKIDLDDILSNTILMLYDYNMFSCDTTDKIPKEDASSNKLSADKADAVGSGGKLELGEGTDECTALSNLVKDNDSSESPGSSGSSGSSKKSNTNAFYDDNKNGDFGNPEESMTDFCYAETSLLYRCELEYLYSGNKVMQKNLDNTRMTIIAERMVFNYLSTYTTKELNNILNTIKGAVSAAFTPAVGIVTDGVLRLAISALEANSDMTQLLSGDTVVLIKSKFTQFSSYEMIKDFLGSASKDEGYDVDTSGKTGELKKEETSKFPEINLNYKQYLMLNILLFTNKADLLNRTRDLMDLNVNKMEDNIEIKDNTVVFKGNINADSEDYFQISEQITVIDAECSVKMSPLFTSLGVEKLTDNPNEVTEYFTDKRTYSVTKGY